MCGIVGMAGNITTQKEKVFKTLLILDSLRGEDSTGVAVVKRNVATPEIVKAVGNPFELLDSKTYDKAMMGFQRVLIGHNRYATTGQVNKKNAHPFTFGNITGVHNGTLNNKNGLHEGYKFDVDSQALLNHIDVHGLKDAINKVGGAWALVWWNEEESTLNFLRNKERTLYMCYEHGGDTVYWASEEWMLRIALSRNNIKYSEPFPVDEDTHFKVTIGPIGQLADWDEEEVKSSYNPFPSVQNYRPGWNNGPGPQAQTALSQATQTPTSTSTKTGSSSSPATSEKKTQLTVVKSASGGYAGRKQRRLRCVSLTSDENSAQYIHCVDANNETTCHIRLYINRNTCDKSMVGKEILADIADSAYTFQGVSGTGFYYKAVYSSVRLADVKKEEVGVTDAFTNFYQNHKGVLIEKHSWEKQYGECASCGTAIDPEHNTHKFTREGVVVCGACINDPQLSGLLPHLH
jgi:hypothetical protein